MNALLLKYEISWLCPELGKVLPLQFLKNHYHLVAACTPVPPKVLGSIPYQRINSFANFHKHHLGGMLFRCDIKLTARCIRMGWDSWLFNLAWSLLFMRREPFRSLFTHTRMRWYEMKSQANRDSNPVPLSQETNHATNWANEAGQHTAVYMAQMAPSMSLATLGKSLTVAINHHPNWCL